MVAIILFTLLIFSSNSYQTFILDGAVFRAAVDSKEISMTAILETVVHIANRNKEINTKKALMLKLLMGSVGVFIFLTFVIQIMTGQYLQA